MGGDRVEGDSLWQKEKHRLRCSPRGHSLQGLAEVKVESSRWPAGPHSEATCVLGQAAPAGGRGARQFLIHSFRNHPAVPVTLSYCQRLLFKCDRTRRVRGQNQSTGLDTHIRAWLCDWQEAPCRCPSISRAS